MASITVRNLSDQSKENLRVQAAQCGSSLEAYVRSILQEASSVETTKPIDILRLARRFFGTRSGINLELPKRGSHREAAHFDT